MSPRVRVFAVGNSVAKLSESTNKNLNSAFQAQLAKTDNNRDHSKENGRRNPSNSELETTRKFLNEFNRGGIVHRETARGR